MIARKALVRGLALAAGASLLAGCISLFPKSEPAQLYRFGTVLPAVQETASGAAPFGVLMTVTGFDRAAVGDRILTVNGAQAAYIKSARWATSS
ncbi:MAG TPA: ABC transporter, partial [Caulobacteraceae bacterium]|nr:ABC transporter [Caulobacteraceae bacterium]